MLEKLIIDNKLKGYRDKLEAKLKSKEFGISWKWNKTKDWSGTQEENLE